MNNDKLVIGGHEFNSRFILGSGKYSLNLIESAVKDAGAEIITLAVRRANTKDEENILDFIPKGITLLPNTSGARNAEEAVRIARLARELGCGNFVKIEIMRDSKYLLPDNAETIKATEILANDGFVVMPYMYPDLNVARDLVNAGAAAVMPLASPIGSNKGLATKDFIQILIDEIDLPIIVDAGIGKPSQACEAMEMGAAAIMANTALATAGNLPLMASAFKSAIEAGRKAYLSGLGRVLTRGASASDPCCAPDRQGATHRYTCPPDRSCRRRSGPSPSPPRIFLASPRTHTAESPGSCPSSIQNDDGCGPCDGSRPRNSLFPPVPPHWGFGCPDKTGRPPEIPWENTWKGHGSGPASTAPPENSPHEPSSGAWLWCKNAAMLS